MPDIKVKVVMLKGEKGDAGSPGEQGVGIASVDKTATVGLIDIYTITYTDGSTSTFTVTNGEQGDDGNGISNVSFDPVTYKLTLYFTDGTSYTTPISLRGEQGEQGETGNGIASIELYSTEGRVKTYRITYTNGGHFDFDVTDGKDIDPQGIYPGLVAGNLLGNFAITESEAYLFRTAGGKEAVGSRCRESLVGGTLMWNQHVNNGVVDNLSADHYWIATDGPNYEKGQGTPTITPTVLIDLTQMFGAAVAANVYDIGTAEDVYKYLVSLFGSIFTDYNGGTLISVYPTAKVVTGFNAYDPESGTAKLLGDVAYQITGTYTALTFNGVAVTPSSDGTFTVSKNGVLTVTGGNATNTCVHLVKDGVRNGLYEAFRENEYPYTDDTHPTPPELNGFPVWSNGELSFSGDAYTPDGTVKRRVILYPYNGVIGNESNWTLTSSGYFRLNLSTNHVKPAPNYESTAYGSHCFGAYTKTSEHDLVEATTEDMLYGLSRSGKGGAPTRLYLMIRDTSCATVHDLVTKITNEKISFVFEKSTYADESFAPFDDPQIVDGFGTEEFTYTGEGVHCPVGHSTDYTADVGAKANAIPPLPKTEGSYVLTVTVTGGVPAYSWVQATAGVQSRLATIQNDPEEGEER